MDNLVAQCVEAIADSDSIENIRDVLRRAVSTGRLAESLPPVEPGLNVLFNDSNLTILNVVWPPNFALFPHNHLMWAALCIYGGREDNTFFRRQDDGLVRSGGKDLVEGDVQMLGADVIHSVRNPGSSHTGAIHVYGGDFFAVERSQWDADTFKEQPYDVNSVNRAFESAEKAFRSEQP
jgi:predicted metal-dependent enzyme (double-stranded beta helix superfamily)